MSDTLEMKKLRNEVQLLRDELVIMKRKYEDIIYNLDTDNFSSRFVKEQDNMKTAIEVTAKGIKTKVSKEDLDGALTQYSTISQTAADIQLAVTTIGDEFKKYSTIEMTADAITSTVSETYITDKIGDKYVSDDTFEQYKVNASSEIQQSANGIYATVMEEVSGEYETKNDAEREYGLLQTSITSVSVTANGLTSRVEKVSKGKYDYINSNGETKTATFFEQSADKFYFDGYQTIFTGAIWLTDNSKKKSFSISHDESQNDQRVIYLHNPYDPLVIGRNQTSVYIGSANTDDTLVATHKWVLDNAGGSGGVARFG